MTGPQFDVSTATAEPATSYPPLGQPPAAAPYTPAPPQGGPLDEAPESLLDTLFAEIEQRDEDLGEPWIYRIKGTRFRLVCDANVDNQDYQAWMKSSLPSRRGRRGRGGGASNPADMNQLTFSAMAIIAQNLRIEVLRKDTVDDWTVWNGPDGEPLTVDSPVLLQKLGVMDPIAGLKKLFGRDATLIDAGQELLEAAGYLPGDDDDEDPTPVAIGARRGKKS